MDNDADRVVSYVCTCTYVRIAKVKSRVCACSFS